MGFDVYGNNPDSAQGTYLRRSIWNWHPLWDYCQSVAPSVTKKVANGHTNEGDGLNDDDALALAQRRLFNPVIHTSEKKHSRAIPAAP